MRKADIGTYGGTREAAMAAIEKCLALAPAATRCLARRSNIQMQEGRCNDVEADAKRIMATDPDSPRGYQNLAEASLAMGKPNATAALLLQQSWGHLPDNSRAWQEANDKTSLAAFFGDYPAAEQNLRELERVAASSNDLYDNVIPAWGRARLYVENGETARAASVADEFLKRKDAWAPDLSVDEFGVEIDMTPLMLDTLRRAGKLSRPDFDQRFAEWTKGWEQRLPRAYLGYVWVYGHVWTATTREDAVKALAAIPKYAPLPWYRPGLLADALVGRTYLQAGQPADALPILERATKSCHVLDDPFTYVQSFGWLGAAREQTGDKPGACAAYGEVARRWKTMPHSVSAREANANIAALGCRITP